MRRVTARVAALAAAVVFAACACAAAPEISVRPETPRIGEVFFVTLHADRDLLRAACSWDGRSYRFLPVGDGFEVVLPVSLTAAHGARHAVVYWKFTDGGMGKAEVPLTIGARSFGVQHLKLTRSQEDTYTAPDTARERRLIGEALDRVTERRHWAAPFLAPVDGRVSTEFGLQRYINGRLSYRHRGVDLACPEGTPVSASAAGVVSLADDSFHLHGKTVVIDHGQGVSSLYIHLSEIAVEAGERVERGQRIGAVGATGVATGPHLHFAVYAHHEAVDPFYWIEGLGR